MSSFERAETIAFILTGAAILLPMLITGIFRIRRKLEERRLDELDEARVRHPDMDDDEL